jgi:hypothetical protein
MKMEKTEFSETSAYKTQTPGNYPEENIQHTEHGKSLKSRIHESSVVTHILFFKSNMQHVSTLKSHNQALKAIPLQAWTGPEGSRRLRLLDFKT